MYTGCSSGKGAFGNKYYSLNIIVTRNVLISFKWVEESIKSLNLVSEPYWKIVANPPINFIIGPELLFRIEDLKIK